MADSLALPYPLEMTNPVAAVKSYGPWPTLADARMAVPRGVRHDGLTVLITGLGEHWWRAPDLSDSGLVPKLPDTTTALPAPVQPDGTRRIPAGTILSFDNQAGDGVNYYFAPDDDGGGLAVYAGAEFPGLPGYTIESMRFRNNGGSLTGNWRLLATDDDYANYDDFVANNPDAIIRRDWMETYVATHAAPGIADTNQLAEGSTNRYYTAARAALKANLADPAFMGIPTAPTAGISANNTQIATTAFVYNAVTNKVTKSTTNQTFLGFSAGGPSNVSAGGDGITAIGSSAGLNNYANNNTFIGVGAGRGNTSGPNNNYFGAYAGQNNTTGQNNAYFGFFAGRLGNGGSHNVFFGSQTGESTSGSANVFLGGLSGRANTTGANNIALGYNSGPATVALDNTISIGTSAQAAASNTMFITDTVKVGIGVQNPASKLAVNGAIESVSIGFKFPDGSVQATAFVGTVNRATTAVTFDRDAEYNPIYSGTFTVDNTTKAIGAVVSIYLGPSAAQPTIPAIGYKLVGGGYVAGKNLMYMFKVGANNQIQYTITNVD